MMKMKSMTAWLVVMMVSVSLALSGCGSSSPAAGGGGGGATPAGTGNISGIVYGANNIWTPTAPFAGTYTGSIIGPLAGATVVLDTTTLMTNGTGSYSTTGLPLNVTQSAAMTGYYAQTMAGVPTTSGQDIHLEALNPPVPTMPVPTASATIMGTINTNAGGMTCGVQAIGANGRILGGGSPNGNGTYSITVNFYNGVTTGNVYIIARETGAWNGVTFPASASGYVANVPVVANASITQNITLTAVNPANNINVNLQNIPAGASVSTQAIVMMILPNNAGEFPIFFGSPLNNVTTYALDTPGIPGATYRIQADAWSQPNLALPPVWSVSTRQTVSGVGTYNIAFLPLPTLTSPTTISAASPASFSWNPVAGNAQYSLNLSQSAAGTTTWGWTGVTSATSITKPIFVPANGGNLTAGQVYSGQLAANDIVFAGLTGAATPGNAFAQVGGSTANTKNTLITTPTGFITNNNVVYPANYKYSAIYFTVNAI